jgi:stearoyl-CoA desaturase (delta-9 desaturase)
MATNEHIPTLIVMRRELIALWARTNRWRKHIIEQLQLWCKKAEHSKE